jgi:hypothetical protein
MYAQQICKDEEPPLRDIGNGHYAACHFAEDTLRSDVGVAHIDTAPEPAGETAAAAS